MMNFISKALYKCDTLMEVMEFFQISDMCQSICPLILKNITLKSYQLVEVHWMILKASSTVCGGILADDCGLGKASTS